MPKLSHQQAQEILQRIARDAQAHNMDPREFLRLLLAGDSQIIGGGPIVDPAIEDPQTHLTDNGYRLDIVDRMHGPMDDFDQLVARREMAMRQAGGDELAAEALLQEQNHAALNAQAQFTRDAPPSATNSILGAQAVIKGNDFNGIDPNSDAMVAAAPTLAMWSGDDSETRPVTVTFAPLAAPQTYNVSAVKPVGIVRFGTRGYLKSVFVDIGQGSQITVSGSQVVAQVGIENQNGEALNSSQQLAAMLSFRPTSPGSPPATRTIITDQASAFGGALIPVPPFAKRVQIFRLPINQTLQVLFVDGSALFTTNYEYDFAADSVVTDKFPISNDTAIIQLKGANISSVRLIFELGF